MGYYGSDSVGGAIRQAFQEADKILMLLHKRFEKDGQQTVGDLRELAAKGIEGLCQRAGIPTYQTTGIFNYRIVKSWLEEVALKKLLFTLLITGKGAEVYAMRRAIDARFGEIYAGEIASAAMFLAEQFVKATESNDYDRITAVMRGTFVASPKLEEYHRQFS